MRELENQSVALIGSGSVGLTLASCLLTAGWKVTALGARRVFEEISLLEDGMSSTYPIKHISYPEDLITERFVIVSVKSHQNASISGWLSKIDNKDRIILVAQNGVDQVKEIRKFCPESHIFPMIIFFNAKRSEPGRVNLKKIGEYDICLPFNKNLLEIENAFGIGGLRTNVTTDITTQLWLKLMVNIAVNPITVLTNHSTGIIRKKLLLESARNLILESYPVALKEGASIMESDIDHIIDWLVKIPSESISSMLQDRRANMPLEHEALTGSVVRAGKRHNIPTPLNSLIYSLVSSLHI